MGQLPPTPQFVNETQIISITDILSLQLSLIKLLNQRPLGLSIYNTSPK